MRNPLLILAGVLAVGLLTACDESIKSPTFVPELLELRVCESVAGGQCPSPAACNARSVTSPSTVPVGLTLQLCAQGRYEGLDSPDDDIFVPERWEVLTNEVEWSAESAAQGLLTVDAGGLVRGIEQSTPLDVIATVPGALSESTNVQVTDPVLERTEIVPGGILGPFLAGTTREFECFAHYTGALACNGQVDPQTCNVSEDSTFVSSDPSVHSIDNGDNPGVGTAQAQGQSNINCSFTGQQSNTAQVRVCDATNITSLDIVPAEMITLPEGGSTQLSLIATYTNCVGDGELQADVTDVADWVSSNEDAATVDAGLVAAVAPGTTQVTGAFGGETSEPLVIAVQDASLARIEVMGPTTILAGINVSAEYTAQAFFTDPDTGEELDPVDISMGDDTFWSSSAPMTLAFPDINSGSATVDQEATPQTLTVQADYLGETATLDVNIVLGTVRALEVIPDAACLGGVLGLGEVVQLQSFGIVDYEDAAGETQSCSTDVTDNANWSAAPVDLTSVLLGNLPLLGEVLGTLQGDCEATLPLNVQPDPSQSPVSVTNAPPKGTVTPNADSMALASGACVYSQLGELEDFASILVAADLPPELCEPLLSAETEPSVATDCADIADPMPAQ